MSDTTTASSELPLHRLLAVARDLNSEKDLDRLLETTVPVAVCELVGAERCTLYLMNEARTGIWSRVAMGLEGEIRLDLGQGLAGVVAQSGESLELDDPYSDPRFARQTDDATGFRTRNILCVPLRDRAGGVMGVFEVMNKRIGSFTAADLDMIELLGRQAAVALEGARLHSELLRAREDLIEQVRRMGILHQIEREVNRSEEFHEILGTVIRLCAEAMNAEGGSILLMEGSESARLYFQYACGEHSDALRRLSIPRGEGLAGWVLENGRSAISNEPGADTRVSANVAEKLEYRIVNLIAAPLSPGGRRLGAMEIVNRKDRGFDTADLQLLDFLASQVSSTIEKKLLLEEARTARHLAAVGSMAARIIHDLKNSMSVIRGLAEMSDNRDVPLEKLLYRRNLMLSAIDGLVAMTQDILDFTRGDLQYDFATIECQAVFDGVLPLLERDCELRDVRLVTSVPEGLTLRADLLKVRRVLFNLATNALDAMPGGGTLTVSAATEPAGGVSVTVSDTGQGIPTAVMERLFEPCVTQGKAHGTGLGLAICKTLIDAHKGRIDASNNPGKGATFHIWLPG